MLVHYKTHFKMLSHSSDIHTVEDGNLPHTAERDVFHLYKTQLILPEINIKGQMQKSSWGPKIS